MIARSALYPRYRQEKDEDPPHKRPDFGIFKITISFAKHFWRSRRATRIAGVLIQSLHRDKKYRSLYSWGKGSLQADPRHPKSTLHTGEK